MERMTHERVGNCKLHGYWSPHKKEALVQQLGLYEDTGLTPGEIREMAERERSRRQEEE